VSAVAPRVRIIGLGSPFGADRIGWQVAEVLRARLVHDPLAVGRSDIAAGIEIELADRPGVGLLSLMEGAPEVILVDAILDEGAGRGGTRVRWVGRDELAGLAASHSSHALGVAEALALGEALGQLPGLLSILGIGVEPGAEEMAHTGVVERGAEMILAALSTSRSEGRPEPMVNT